MSSIIGWMARHPVAANLLMALLIAAGLFNAFSIEQKTFPDTTTDTVEVRVEYRGASPVEILESVIQRIEEQVASLDGIDEMTATASEGVGLVRMVLDRGIDVPTKVDEIRTEIDRITSFPEEAEQPEVRKVTDRERAVDLVIYGDVPERALKEIAYQTRDQLMALPEISFADVDGVRKYEVSVEISLDSLRAFGLTLPEVAAAIRAESLELPAGTISSAREELGVRTLGRNYGRLDFEEIVLRVGGTASRVRLGDVASVSDGFEENDLITRFRDSPVATVRVFRVGEEQVLGVVAATLAFVEADLGASLPPGVGVYVWRNQAQEFESRLTLLKRNAAIACVLVLAALALFLNLRLAFWVSLGIAVSFVSAFTVMATFGVSLNSISAFGFILAVGIVVDDAIVTGEKIFELRRAGTPPIEAAVLGAQRMSRPVIFAVLTTIAAFAPLLTVPGVLGQVMGEIPTIVIIVLVLSLVESLLILPHHLAHARIRALEDQQEGGWFSRLQRGLDRRLKAFVDGPLDRALLYSTEHWGVVIAAALSLLLLTFGILSGGYVKFEFFPSPEGRYVTANLELFEGTPVSRTLALARKIEVDGYAVAADYVADSGDENIVQSSYLVAGNQAGERSPLGSTLTVARPHVSSVTIELNQPESREISAEAFEQLWRRRVGTLEGVQKLVFTSSLFSIAEPVMVELSADNASELEYAIRTLKDRLGEISGVFDIRDDRASGKTEFNITLRPRARDLGITLESLGGQVRAAFFGAEAVRVQRGREEVRVYVRLPESERNSRADLARLRIRSPGGGFAPLNEVARITEGSSPTTIRRRDGRSIVSVTADVDPTEVTALGVTDYLADEVFVEIRNNAPSVALVFAGERREIADAVPTLARNFALALIAIFALLAIPFRSYLQPLIVMAAIPFGLTGAILGHLILGINLTMPGIFGIIGLSGVIVNGSLVLLDFADEERQRGADLRTALILAAKGRFRPILLTSLTTFLGVSPLIFDQSIQSQFLAPMATSLGFGVIAGTAILILLVPALAMARERVATMLGATPLANR